MFLGQVLLNKTLTQFLTIKDVLSSFDCLLLKAFFSEMDFFNQYSSALHSLFAYHFSHLLLVMHERVTAALDLLDNL